MRGKTFRLLRSRIVFEKSGRVRVIRAKRDYENIEYRDFDRFIGKTKIK